MKRNRNYKIRKSNAIKTLPRSLYSYHTIQQLPFEKTKKILLNSGLKLTDQEVKVISEILHKIAELIIKEFITK